MSDTTDWLEAKEKLTRAEAERAEHELKQATERRDRVSLEHRAILRALELAKADDRPRSVVCQWPGCNNVAVARIDGRKMACDTHIHAM